MKKEEKFYAFFVPDGPQGITSSWAETEKKVKGVPGARYKAFGAREDAEAWLARGAMYEPAPPAPKLLPGIYFDAGTGRGEGVEVSVTDEKGNNLLHKAVSRTELNRFGKQLLDDPAATNNYGELLALRYALEIAMKMLKRSARGDDRGGDRSGDGAGKAQKIFGDSRLVVDYWSQWRFKRKVLPAATVALAEEVSKLREEFEKKGGTVERIAGAHNPADLGFH